MPIHVTADSFPREVLEADRPVLIDFYADWCGPCRALAPVLDEIERDVPYIKVVKINIDEEKALARQFNVASIPTLVVMQNGEAAQRMTGLHQKSAILEMLRQ